MSVLIELIRVVWRKFHLADVLLNKRYTDNTGPSYTYKPSGRLLTRTWARGVQTTYAYNAAGDLTGTTYSNGTPAVTIAYDRAGRPKTMTDASGTRALTYDTSGQLKDEDYTAGLLNTLGVRRTYDSQARLGSVSVSSVYSVAYEYDPASRLATVTAGTNTATYAYIPNSPLVGSVVFKQGGVTRLATTKAYDNLNRLSSVSSVPLGSPEPPGGGGSARSAFYQYNSANQRTRATREDNAYWQYEYDSLGQVTVGRKHLPTDAIINGLDFGWSFDDIGNRKAATTNSQISNYSANLLNQYSSRTVPGVIDVMGAAQSDATVTVMSPATNGTVFPTIRQGETFHKQLTVDNASASQYASVKVTGVKNLVGSNGEDAVTEETRNVLVTGTPEIFIHDADGNLTADAKWSYSWDGENRLASVETTASAAAAGLPKQKLEFAYDGQSRRVQKRVYDWASGAWTLRTSLRFVYDGWDLLAEVNDTGAAVRTYAWGIDLSGSLQGAGGVGGLLFANLDSATHAPAFDANGNVLGLIDQATGTKSAEYEYGAFGELLKSDGPAADALPLKFSTKYTDQETGIVMFPLRPYYPPTGRFLTDDPLGEEGGLNLYGFVENDPTNGFDPLGLYDAPGHFDAPYIGTQAAGYSPDDAFKLAYWTQYPDLDPSYDAMRAPSQNRRAVREYLHSLTGGDAQKLREYLTCLLKSGEFKLLSVSQPG